MPAGSSTSKKTPVRMSKLFSQMLTECPLDVQVYGKCVADIHGGVNRQACEKEFQKLRACFERVARQRRG
ncbi:hypothetical protein F441_10462 [Phytophthora nicotianae CJ01A1]|uniref:IMS import disulfide relay-system CHCH-CHCH-like Cx9C domain-containing protein n=6 Tax=Phytophthora nicotianae TaxID=4792 RepID=W2RAZ0_PHYN3|nr:hypothetical protein PPTG_01930 [Phytophthora nicotianae INRA-310]ETI44769.1 hypothetical protein F443_10525 [Phytophthora nicotianae P1569]ETK84778.1 hypothetical protein L915_10282 [Phytophthora nicotianae]ETO73434.1 hypothetical protein F444_10615 [Phytophthora nicotianae P1976]ETP14615.1 hypothetical protein F441_10462 [Phytophthora nicotianae CJ01A1]ETP42688.1 hypothetical protein F442_10422 [Phytophthora nicotianae P10297]